MYILVYKKNHFYFLDKIIKFLGFTRDSFKLDTLTLIFPKISTIFGITLNL